MAKKRRAGWMSEHVSDPFVKRAQLEGFRSRAVYKLLEIDEKHRLFRPWSTSARRPVAGHRSPLTGSVALGASLRWIALKWNRSPA